LVSRVLIVALLVTAAPVWGGQSRQLCLSCHSVHYAERGGCSDCHLGNPGTERKNIAHAGLRSGKYALFTLGDSALLREGQGLMDLLACRRCHVSAGRGNSLAASLDGAAMRKSAGELALSIRLPVANMPNFSLDEARITTLVNIILAGSLGRETDHTAPVKVHYKDSAKKNLDIFSKKCGGCHRIVSERLGAIGTSDTGPNLSGLFSSYYPKSFKSGGIWNAQNLRTWLKNPRETRQWTRMQPVALTENEMNELESIIIISKTLSN